MRIGLMGIGAIGSFLVKSLPQHSFIVYDVDPVKAEKTLNHLRVKNAVQVARLNDVKNVDLLIEAASQEAVPLALPFLRHSDVLIMSVGALTNEHLLHDIQETAKKYGHCVWIPSGAVGGLDVLQACEPKRVVLETRKNPKSLGRNDLKETVLFEGSAHVACKKFPKNVNVAATVALAGIGFEKTRVRVISDPAAKKNTHTLYIEGKTGGYQFVFGNLPFPKNPRTSALAAYSAKSLIEKKEQPLQIG